MYLDRIWNVANLFDTSLVKRLILFAARNNIHVVNCDPTF